MFQLEEPNITFEYFDTCSKGRWGQRPDEYIQGQQGSLSVKNKEIAISHKLLNF